MGIQIIGQGGQIQQIDATWRASRVTSRPLDHGTLGQYRFSQIISLVVTQAANSTLFSLRWTDATRLFVPVFMRLELIQTAAATATIMPAYQVFIARSFTAPDSAGANATLTGNNAKKRTSMGSSLLVGTDVRWSTVAAGLTVGTRVNDVNAIMEMLTQSTITTPNNTVYRKELDFTNSLDHPIVLVQNEGLVVRGPTVVFGAAGTASLIVELAWAELTSYDNTQLG